MTDQLDLDADPVAGPSEGDATDDVAALGEADEDLATEGGDAAAPGMRRRFARRPRGERVSRWDRPPEPRDWRFYVGNLGRILIATGLMLFGFVAYQLWGTGIETARAQNRLEGEFAALLEEFADGTVERPAVVDEPDATGDDGAPPDAAEPATDVVADAETDAAPNAETGSDDGAGAGAVAGPPDVVAGDVERGVPVAIDLSDQAVVQNPLPLPERGDPLFRLEIPAIGRDDIVVAGVRLDDLKNGPGHYNDTPLPGQLGNAAVAGHRTTYGAPFFDVDDLVAGDELITTLANGDRFVYEVTFVEVVEASDYWVVSTFDENIAELTLTSCHPKWTARQRIVVHSVLNPDKSSNVGFPTFYELEPDDSQIIVDDPVLVADGVLDIADGADPESGDAAPADPDDTAGGADDGRSDGTAESDAEIGAESDATAEDAPDDDAAVAAGASDDPPRGAVAAAPGDPVDAFSQGWFDDTAAWPQIALWGALLALVAVLAYQAAKATRRYTVGFVVGVVPFLVTLYFFYQNVNRLLPPGI